MLESRLKGLISRAIPKNLKDVLSRVVENDARALKLRSKRLHRLIGRRVTVLPPDTRHVDYEVIPLMVADGCLYKCGFCRVKSGQDFAPRAREDIQRL
jgi:tRNA A37 methylthiotransferase MiaB